MELIEKSVKNLKDWVELVESHELGNSEKEIEHSTTLINKLGLNKGNTHEPRYRFRVRKSYKNNVSTQKKSFRKRVLD